MGKVGRNANVSKKEREKKGISHQRELQRKREMVIETALVNCLQNVGWYLEYIW